MPCEEKYRPVLADKAGYFYPSRIKLCVPDVNVREQLRLDEMLSVRILIAPHVLL